MTTGELEKCFGKARVLVIGDLMLDEYLMGTVSRISPEAPVPVVDFKRKTHVAGGAANVAVNIRSLGGTVSLVGLAGADDAGRSLRQILQREGIGDEGLVDSRTRGTISKTRILAGQQQIVRIDQEDRSPVPSDIGKQLVEKVRGLLPASDVCVLSDYAKGTLTTEVASAIISDATAMQKPVIVDPKGLDYRKYAGCSIITPNLHEAAAACSLALDTEERVMEAGHMLMGMLTGSNILITRGADGMTLFAPGGETWTVHALAKKVFDVVGAGDTVVAGLAVALAAGLPLNLAVRLATVAAAVVVSKPGTATATPAEITATEGYAQLLADASLPAA